MKKMILIAVWCAFCGGLQAQSMNMYIVKESGFDKKLSCKLLMKEEIDLLEKRVALEKKYFPKALINAAKAWRVAGFKEKYPKKIYKRKISVGSKSYTDLGKATETITKQDEKIDFERKVMETETYEDMGRALQGMTGEAMQAMARKKWSDKRKVNERKELLQKIATEVFIRELDALIPSDEEDEMLPIKLKTVTPLANYYELSKKPPCPVIGSKDGNIAGDAVVTLSSCSVASWTNGLVDGVVWGGGENYSNEWCAAAQTTGAVARLTWKAPQIIDRIVLFDRKDAGQNIEKGLLTFSDGSKLEVGKLPPEAKKGLDLKFKAKKVQWVEFLVDGVGKHTVETGLAEIMVFSRGSWKEEQWPNMQSLYELPVGLPCVFPGKLYGNIAESAKISVSSEMGEDGMHFAGENAADGIVGGRGFLASRWEWSGDETEATVKITLKWSRPQNIDRIVVFGRDGARQIEKASLVFNDGTFVNLGEFPSVFHRGIEVRIKPKLVKTIKFEVIKPFNKDMKHIGLSEIGVFKTGSK